MKERRGCWCESGVWMYKNNERRIEKQRKLNSMQVVGHCLTIRKRVDDSPFQLMLCLVTNEGREERRNE